MNFRLPLFLLIAVFLAAGVHAGDSLSYSEKARELLNRGEFEQALDELKEGASLFPYDLSLRRALVSAYVEVAQREMKLARYDQAAEHVARAKELVPESKDLSLIRGVALYFGKKYDAAKGEFEAAGDQPQPLIYLGRISYDTGDLPGAIATWRRALELDPQNKTALSLVEKAERELPVESKMEKGYSSMFDLSLDAELPPGLAAEVLDALESAYNSVGADLGFFPTTRIPVLIYTKKDYSSVTAGPDWSGGLYDGKIRLPVGGITKLTPQLRGVIFHEFTHVLISEMTHGNIPTWLNEGLAEVEGRKEYRPHHTPELRPLSLAVLSGPFIGMGSAEAGAAYQQSYAMVQFMVTRYGWYALQQILKRLGERDTVETAVAGALSDWSLDLPAVMREWRDSLPSAAAASANSGE